MGPWTSLLCTRRDDKWQSNPYSFSNSNHSVRVRFRCYLYKPVGDKTPRLAQMSLPWKHGSAPLVGPLVGPNISGLCGIQAELYAILCQILGIKFWGLGSLNQKSKTTLCRVPREELTARKWLNSIEIQKRRIDLKERDRQTDRQSQRQKNSRLLG